MARLLKEPLLHFLALGLLIFLVAGAAGSRNADDKTITIDREDLLLFIQYRSKAFEPSAADAMLDGLDSKERARLVEDYAREEALDREARALGLERNDYVIRQRLVQKVEFLAEAGAPVEPVSDTDVEAHYRKNARRFTSPPTATFTHAFFALENNSAGAAIERARGVLKRLKDANAGFNGAAGLGDRFLFHRNYVDRTEDYIRSQFGDEATDAIFSERQPLDAWFGPLRSEHGVHLVYISARTPEQLAPLADVFDTVKADLVEGRRQSGIDRAIDAIVGQYTIVDRTADGG